MYKHEDIINLVAATIVLHNMMVKVRINNNETDSLDFYNHVKSLCGVNGEDDIDSSEDDVSNVAKAPVGNFDMSSKRDHTLKYRIVQEQKKAILC